MRPTIEELHNDVNFNLIQSFHVDETMKFLLGQLDEKPATKKTWKQKIVLGLIMIGLGAAGYQIGKAAAGGNMQYAQMGYQAGFGFLAMYLIALPIHEAIHALVFKYFKAPKVGFGVSLKAGMVYAYAQEFPISMPELITLAVMPFAITTPLLCIGWLILPQYMAFFITLLLIHSLGCIGDFALIRYALKNKHRQIFTYDDLLKEKKTYFFEKK